MSRNTSGTYTLPSGNPVVSGSVISSVWANDTMNDIATALTDSLSRSGKGGMSAAFRSVDGVVATPGISFNNETGSGLYRAGAGDVRMAILGADLLSFTSTGIGIGTGSPAQRIDVRDGNIRIGGSVNGKLLGYNSGNTQVFDFGVGSATGVSTDVGLVNLAAGSVVLGTNGVERVRLDVDGNLTISMLPSNTSAQTANVYVDANGKLYKGQAPAAFAAGTVMLFVQTTAPTGWTKSTTHNDKALRVVSGAASSGGSYTFSSTFANGNAGATTLSTSQIPSHTHGIPYAGSGNIALISSNAASWNIGLSSSGSIIYTGEFTAFANGGRAVISAAGGGGSHTHSLSLAVAYVDVIIAVKD